MPDSETTRIDQPPAQQCFLAVYRGDALLEVFELPPTGRLTVGRAHSNRIVIPDSKCSREHCEFFHRNGQWNVRDLGSRNGISIEGERVTTETALTFGQVIRIGSCSLLFTNKQPENGHSYHEEKTSDFNASCEIIERKSGTQYDHPLFERLKERHDGSTELFRIARGMASAETVTQLCKIVLDGLMRTTGAGIGGILLDSSRKSTGTLTSFVPVSVSSSASGQRFSTYLSQIVLQDRHAVLAHDINEHSVLAVQDSLMELRAKSAICAPIRHADDLLGIIHLYCITAEHSFTHRDLECVLAVADQMGDQLHSLIERESLATGLEKTRQQVHELTDQLRTETELVGNGPRLNELRKSISKVSPTDALVLIRGESGVGKELVARAVHDNSHRKEGPFVCVNCAALTESLLESELFGHEKGAFTGATSRRLGKFEQADGGTLFLDEIGEMSPEIQAKFLRVLEGQPFERVGGGDPISVDVRVVTATNRDLESAVREGRFRKDLFRLQVIEIVVPPLREHLEDLPKIAQHFVERFATKSNFKGRGFGTEAIRKLQSHSWPGNVRELRNVIERAVILSENDILQPDDVVLTTLNFERDEPQDQVEESNDNSKNAEVETCVDPIVDLFGSFIQQETSLEELDQLYLQAVLNSTNWNKSQAARILQIERTTLDRRLKKYRISRPDGEEDED